MLFVVGVARVVLACWFVFKLRCVVGLCLFIVLFGVVVDCCFVNSVVDCGSCMQFARFVLFCVCSGLLVCFLFGFDLIYCLCIILVCLL